MALAATAQPQVTWLERQHDFGVFKEENGKVSCDMALVNTGNAPLIACKPNSTTAESPDSWERRAVQAIA